MGNRNITNTTLIDLNIFESDKRNIYEAIDKGGLQTNISPWHKTEDFKICQLFQKTQNTDLKKINSIKYPC